jgi:hypothetical protein
MHQESGTRETESWNGRWAAADKQARTTATARAGPKQANGRVSSSLYWMLSDVRLRYMLPSLPCINIEGLGQSRCS